MNRPAPYAFLISAALSALATYPSIAGARLLPASSCTAQGPISGRVFPYVTGLYNRTTSAEGIMCGYPDVQGDTKSSVSGLWVDALLGPGSGPLVVFACSQSWTGTQLKCSANKNSPAGQSGPLTVTLSGSDVTSIWGSAFASSYGSVYVGLPNNSLFYGITTF